MSQRSHKRVRCPRSSPVPASRSVIEAACRLALLVMAVGCAGCDLLSPDPPAVKAVWTAPLPGPNAILGAHGFDSTALYVRVYGDTTRFVKLDAKTGRSLWVAPQTLITAGPSKLHVHEGLLLVAATGGVVAYRTNDGSVAWQRPLPGHLHTAPGIDTKTLYVPDQEGAVTALVLASGLIRWRWEDTASSGSRLTLFAAGVIDSVVYAVGRISGLNAGGDRGVVLALDAATGRERHRFTTPELRSDYRSVRSDGRGGLLLGNRARSGMDDLDPSTWSFRWRVSRPRNEVFPVSDLAVRDGILYVGWQDVVAIDVATGRELWSRGSRGTTASTVVCGQQVVSQHLNLSFFDRATGRLEAFNDWQDGQFPYSDLVEDGERVYATSENFAYAFPCRR